MESKPLKQLVALVLDTLGMKGPVERRAVAEEVYQQSPADYWSVFDEREAKIQYLHRYTTTVMNEPLPDYVSARLLPAIPTEIQSAIKALPHYICISERGGHRAQHVMTWKATAEDWDANFRLKDFVTNRARDSRNEARQVRDLLRKTGAHSLMELFTSAPQAVAANGEDAP